MPVRRSSASRWWLTAASQSRKRRYALAQDVSPGKSLTDCNESRKGRHSSRTSTIALRMGLRYVRGLREEAAQALVRERMRAPFASIHDLTRRVPELRKDELTTLAEIGALNSIGIRQETLDTENSQTDVTDSNGRNGFNLKSTINNQKFLRDSVPPW